MNNSFVEKTVKDVVEEYVRQQNDVTLELACKLAKAVILKARQIGVKATVAVTNKGGHPILVNADDDSYIASYDIALNKAFTVVALKMNTKKLADLAKPGGSLYGIQYTNDGKLVIFGGGEPLINKNNIVIGGLGVSGGSEAQDTELAKYGREVFEKGL